MEEPAGLQNNAAETISDTDRIDEKDLPKLIKHELALAEPPVVDSGDERSSELSSLYEDTPGKRIFDKHVIDVGVASRIIKGIKEYNDACKLAEEVPSVTNLSERIQEGTHEEKFEGQNKTEVTKKVRTLREALTKKKEEEEQASLLPPLFTKIHQGLVELYELIDDGTESVTNVRVAAVRDEIERLKDDQCERFALEGYIAKKELEALEEYKKIDEKWEHIGQLKDPLNIHNETLAQREKCNTLLQEKDNVIQFLRETLKKKDETFLKEVENQGNDIDILIDRIQNQIYIFKETYTKQLETLEEIIDEEKKVMIESNRENWESLIKDKEEVDKAILEKLANIMDSHESAMRIAEKEQNEYQRKIRTKLHKYINDLTVQVDHLKSICTLNIEKMTYNYHVLLKKQQENQLIKQKCKRFAVRMQNNLSMIRKQIKQGSQSLANQLVEKANTIDKLQNKINALDKRCHSLISSESKIYFDLWAFNEQRAENLLDQIFAADKILYEKILFMPWTPPAYIRLEKSIMPSYEEAKKLSEYIKKKTKPAPKHLPKLAEDNEVQKERLTKIVLNNIRKSCPFFVDEKRKAEISHLSSTDQYMFELENVFEALGLKTKEDVELMVKYFLPYITCGECIEKSSNMKEFIEYEKEACIKQFFEKTDLETTTSPEKVDGNDDLSIFKGEQFDGEDSQEVNLIEDSDKKDYVLSDMVKKRLQVISNIVAEETLNEEEYRTIKKYGMTVQDKDYKRDSAVLEVSLSESQDIIERQDILAAETFFGLTDHKYNLDWLVNMSNKAPLKYSVIDVPEKSEKEECLMICSDPFHQPFINPIDVAKALRDFTIDFYKAKEKQTNITMEELLAKPRMSPSRVIDSAEVSNYWKAYTEFFTPQKIRLWETMLYGLQDYQKALNKRHHLNIELKKIQRSNLELRRLLQRYIKKNPEVQCVSERLLSGLARSEF